jgi:hypothetical protein
MESLCNKNIGNVEQVAFWNLTLSGRQDEPSTDLPAEEDLKASPGHIINDTRGIPKDLFNRKIVSGMSWWVLRW